MKLVSFKIDPEEWQQFRAVARKGRKSRSAILREFVCAEVAGDRMIGQCDAAQKAFTELIGVIQEAKSETNL